MKMKALKPNLHYQLLTQNNIMPSQPFEESKIQNAYRSMHTFFNHFMISDAVNWLEGILRAATTPLLFLEC